MKFFVVSLFLFLGTFQFETNAGYHDNEVFDESSEETEYPDQQKKSDSCPVVKLEGVQWILHVRELDFGWKQNTHRAVIALAVNGWSGISISERKLIELQLEVKLSVALLKNSTSPIYPNNLALYINALIAINKNPRDFHSIDLVEHLKYMIRISSSNSHPFLLLALCNANSIEQHDLKDLEIHLIAKHTNWQYIEYKALAVQAYECAKSLRLKVNQSLLDDVRKYLATLQYPDGSFGNVYTTCIIVQALHSFKLKWDKNGAINFLKKQSSKEENMIFAYLIQLALSVERVQFIKDLYPELKISPTDIKAQNGTFIQYTIKVGPDPDVRHTITIRVKDRTNFFEIMKICSDIDPKFNFSYYMDKNNKPSVYAISNIPNDAEENLFWRLCLVSNAEYVNHTFKISTLRDYPVDVYPNSTQHIIYWYNDRDCY